MRKWMISLLSILAVASMFIGCGGSEGSVSGVSNVDTQDKVSYIDTESDAESDTVALYAPGLKANCDDINPELGCPPAPSAN